MKALLIASSCVLLAAAVPAVAGDAAAGKEKSKTCAACHGPDGNSPAADFPRLAGQHYDYLLRAISEYKSGVRKSAIMMPMVDKLTRRDMEDLAAYFSQEKGLFNK
ncbi:MAG TPA: cytochrome c [Burkholderiales bacterium]|jgi:cytochrome c553|nr:cytochrome c [Burkholderiales bacterium]